MSKSMIIKPITYGFDDYDIYMKMIKDGANPRAYDDLLLVTAATANN